jgi:hypothetical protein
MKVRIDELFRLVDDENYPAATELLAELEGELGSDDHDLVKARWLIESEAAQNTSAAS